MLACAYQHGATRAGFIPMTRAAGSNGIVAIILAAVCQKRMLVRSSAGRQSGATSPRSNVTVNQVIRRVDGVSGRHYFIGPTTAENYERCPILQARIRKTRARLGSRLRPRYLPGLISKTVDRCRRFQNRI